MRKRRVTEALPGQHTHLARGTGHRTRHQAPGTIPYHHGVLLLIVILAVMALVITSWLTGLILRRLRRRP
jgi:hypothetical protein